MLFMIHRKQLGAARGGLGIKQEKLAADSGVGLSTVRSFEKGPKVPGIENVKAIKEVLENEGARFTWRTTDDGRLFAGVEFEIKEDE